MKVDFIGKPAKGVYSKDFILARAEDVEQMKVLYSKGVTYVVQPEFEASIEIVSQTLLNLGVPADQLKTLTEDARQELNKTLCV